MKSKYIIISTFDIEVPIIFNPLIDHGLIACNEKVISAGFCHRHYDGSFSIWGESISLKIKSRPEDVEILNKMIEIDI